MYSQAAIRRTECETPEAPQDGKYYAMKNGSWVAVNRGDWNMARAFKVRRIDTYDDYAGPGYTKIHSFDTVVFNPDIFNLATGDMNCEPGTWMFIMNWDYYINTSGNKTAGVCIGISEDNEASWEYHWLMYGSYELDFHVWNGARIVHIPNTATNVAAFIYNPGDNTHFIIENESFFGGWLLRK